jgi:hypothetical protein
MSAGKECTPNDEIRRASTRINSGIDHDDLVAFDPLFASVPLPHKLVLFPYGFPAHIKTNDPTIIRAAEVIWGQFTARFHENPVELRVLVSSASCRHGPRPPVFRAQANLFTVVSDGNNYGCCDLATGFGFAHLTRNAALRLDFVRYYFLEGMIYSLLDTQYIATIHAACVGRKGSGVLLVGEEGAGKSSLAYACSRRGWTYVSDDASSLVIRRKGRTVIGNPRAFRFRPSAALLFPELQRYVKHRAEESMFEARTESFPKLKTAQELEIQYVIFLKRNVFDDEEESLTPVERADRFRRLFQNRWPPELPIHENRMAAIERLIEAPAYELSYCDLDRAVNLLERLLDKQLQC